MRESQHVGFGNTGVDKAENSEGDDKGWGNK